MVTKLFGKIENWDVSNVTNMSSLFANAHSFNQPLNKWNVSNVRYMGGMFEYAESFNQPLNKWNVFTYFPGTCQMWTTCMCLMVQPPSISRSMLLGTGNSQMLVNNMGFMFGVAESFN